MELDTSAEVGDFLLRNAHGIYSYHLANVVDDMRMNITHVVRGADLALFTPAHLQVQGALGGTGIHYHHLPLALDADGHKLSKQTLAPPVQIGHASQVLFEVFNHLGLKGAVKDNVRAMLSTALEVWP